MSSGRLSALLTLAMPVLWVLGRIPVFHAAYVQHLQRLEDDAWLRTQCADPIFVSRMMRHHDVCQRVRESFRQPAFLVAMQACVPSEWQALLPSVGWETLLFLALLLFLLAPTVLLPLYRVRRDRFDHLRMLEACSPDLPIPWRYAKPLFQTSVRRRAVAPPYLLPSSSPSSSKATHDIISEDPNSIF